MCPVVSLPLSANSMAKKVPDLRFEDPQWINAGPSQSRLKKTETV
jgi:hypothetical protein